MEMWNVLDSFGNFTGITRYRSAENKFYHASAEVWIINSENKFLIQKRASQKKFQPNVWAMTGGNVIAGETEIDTIKRETLEELGIILNVENLIKIKRYKSLYAWVTVYVIKQDVDLDRIKIKKDEVSEVKFVTYNELDEIYQNKMFFEDRWEHVRDELKRFIQNNNKETFF